MTERNRPEEHEKFRELSALANSGTLTLNEWAELQNHLRICKSCNEIYYQYQVVATEGISLLAARYGPLPEQRDWNATATREKLLARVSATKQQVMMEPADRLPVSVPPGLLSRRTATPILLAIAALAACIVVGSVGLVVHRLDTREQAGTKHDLASAEDRIQRSVAEKMSIDELLSAQTKNLSRLQDEISQKDQRLAELQSELRMARLRANKSTDTNSSDALLQEALKQRVVLSAKITEDEQAYQNVQAELTKLRDERDKALFQTATLESKIETLTAINQDHDRKLRDDEQYLASDRDIRELMGARSLYIADVYDVDGRSRTQKPYGRIFYTEGKSLLFYAFDLDNQRGPKNASTFQAWGRTDAHSEKPLSLGIFYMDSKANRRWVLRFDDPEKLAEIESVFVTVEPNGGSRKPTGKPFLYALLRKEANHP
jgi:hypothetical protein